MQRKVMKLLYDVEQACLALHAFAQGRMRADLDSDLMFRSAVERQFEIIGEALSQASRLDTTLAEHITDFANIISFRHHLIHGYSMVDLDVVWFTLTNKLPILLVEIRTLLKGTL
jgi:uncharacterized protein with HEPN domain